MTRPPRVQFCIHNPPIAARRWLLSIGATSHDCFTRCSRCFTTPYLVIDDDHGRRVLEGTSYPDILRRGAPDLLAQRPAAPASPVRGPVEPE